MNERYIDDIRSAYKDHDFESAYLLNRLRILELLCDHRITEVQALGLRLENGNLYEERRLAND